MLADELARQTAGDPPPVEQLLVRYLADRLFQTEQGISYPAEAVAAWMLAEDRLGRVLAAGERRAALNSARLSDLFGAPCRLVRRRERYGLKVEPSSKGIM